jgi:hypothetical protein
MCQKEIEKGEKQAHKQRRRGRNLPIDPDVTIVLSQPVVERLDLRLKQDKQKGKRVMKGTKTKQDRE